MGTALDVNWYAVINFVVAWVRQDHAVFCLRFDDNSKQLEMEVVLV